MLMSSRESLDSPHAVTPALRQAQDRLGYAEAGVQRLCSPGARSATAPVLLYLLPPCSRPAERGILAVFSLASRRASRFAFTVGAPSGAMLLDVVIERAVLEHARQLLPALRSTWMCECRGRRMRWSDLSTAVPDAVLPPPSMGSYLLHPCSRPSERGIHAGYSLASRRASVFLLRGQEKVTKEKATPHSRPTHSPCAPGSRGRSGVR
jgi:hypothetical protein